MLAFVSNNVTDMRVRLTLESVGQDVCGGARRWNRCVEHAVKVVVACAISKSLDATGVHAPSAATSL